MNPHMEWFCEYEKCNVGDVFLGDKSIANIIGCGSVKLVLKYGRIITLLEVLHIPNLAKNLIFVSKMSDVSVHIIFEKETWKMVRGSMVLMSGV
jgi:hypothetical protein